MGGVCAFASHKARLSWSACRTSLSDDSLTRLSVARSVARHALLSDLLGYSNGVLVTVTASNE